MSNALNTLDIGDKAPEIVNAVIEIPKGSHNKYEFDEHTGTMRLDRVLYSPIHYPLDYGFIPATRSEDGDHLDILIIGNDPLFPGCVLEARPIALMNMIDSGDPDAKILAVQVANPRFAGIKDIEDVNQWNDHLLKEIAHFFEAYKKLEGKVATVQGWQGADAARAEILKAKKAYTQ